MKDPQVKEMRVVLLNVLGNNTDGDEEKNRWQLLFNYLVMSLPLEHLCKHFFNLFIY